MTIDELGINQMTQPRVSDAEPSLTTFTVTFANAGVYRFYCKVPVTRDRTVGR